VSFRERAAVGGRPKKSLGQHFLTDPQTARAVVHHGGITQGTPVLEIGPGRGFLTRYLAEAGAHILVIEKDARLAQQLPGRLPQATLEVLNADFLEADLEPVLARCPVIVGNLPYNVSLAILSRTLEYHHVWPRVLFMFQLEVAQRICAPPGSRTYGMPSILAGLTHEAAIVRRIAPGSFHPPPKVHSALVCFKPQDQPLLAGQARLDFLDFAGLGFRYRRKTAANGLSRTGLCSAAEIAAHLEAAGLSPTVRIEAIPLRALVDVWRVVTRA
jgi:16S rRNA (adenine1518-N6/adenine1519-N6)-dimethyltransferase